MDYFNDNATTHLKKMDTTVDNLANTDLEVTNQSITDRLNNTLDIMKAESKSFLPWHISKDNTYNDRSGGACQWNTRYY